MASGEMRCTHCKDTAEDHVHVWRGTGWVLFCDWTKTNTFTPAAVPESAIEPEPHPKKHRERCASHKDGARCSYHYSHLGPHGNEENGKQWFDLAAASSAIEVAPQEQGTFWVIERFEDGKSQGYWFGNSSREFSTDIDMAIQFRRKQDAQIIRRAWHWKDCEVTEHMYLSPSVAPREAQREPIIYDQKCLDLACHFLPSEVPETVQLAAHIWASVDKFLHPTRAVPSEVAPSDHQPPELQQRCRELCGESNGGYHDPECPILKLVAPSREQRLEDALREVLDLLSFHEGSGVPAGSGNSVIVVNEEDWNTALRVARAALEAK